MRSTSPAMDRMAMRSSLRSLRSEARSTRLLAADWYASVIMASSETHLAGPAVLAGPIQLRQGSDKSVSEPLEFYRSAGFCQWEASGTLAGWFQPGFHASFLSFQAVGAKNRLVRGPRTPGGLPRRPIGPHLRPLNFVKTRTYHNGDRQGIEGDRSSEGRQGGRSG